MPRARRSVTFWRGATPTRGDARFLPAKTRWTGTSVEGWPSGYRRQLRAELLRARDAESLGIAALTAHANRWAQARARPAGVTKTISNKHVADLLRGADPAPAPPARPPEPAPKLSAEEIREWVRRSLAAELAAKQRKTASRTQPRRSASRKKAKPQRRVAMRAGTPRGAAEKAPHVDATPGAPPPFRAARAGSTLIVRWDAMDGAARVRVDVLDQTASRVARTRVDATAGEVKLGKLPPGPLTVELLATSPSGGVLFSGALVAW